MLTSLRIEHFALVKVLELDFLKGLSAFTGETGAGKSIMIDALLLALGERAESALIRPGEEKCEVLACFHIEEKSEVAAWLAAHELEFSEEVILKRILYQEGGSKAYINGQRFPLQKLKELSGLLVHVYGQHQHQALLQPSVHREQLDLYAGHEALLSAVEKAFQQVEKIHKKIQSFKSTQHEKDKEDLLAFKLKELQSFKLRENEFKDLEEEHQLLHHAQSYLLKSEEIRNLLKDAEPFNLCKGLSQILNHLKALPEQQKPVQEASDLLSTALIQCEEAATLMQDFSQKVQLDPKRLQELEERLSNLYALARKYQVDKNHLLSHQQQLEAEYQALKDSQQDFIQLEKDYLVSFESYKIAAKILSDSRRQAAKKMAQEITGLIQQLGMPQGHFEIEVKALSSESLQSHGQDRVEYKICTNLGMPLNSLTQIASGGELSRIGLCIQMITAQRSLTPTLIFDEVDVGIGGATAALLGLWLRLLGEKLQIFCVTHQAQVAASAHHQYQVEKYSENNQTYSRIFPLNKAARIPEIARMLSGLTLTDQTLSHAEELLQQAEKG